MITKENTIGNKNPLFLRFINRESGVVELLNSIIKSSDIYTSEAAQKALLNPPNLDDFRIELEGAVRDLIKDGPSEEFRAFVNHYMENSLSEDTSVKETQLGQSRSQIVFVRDENAPWLQGIICYNLSLYIKAFGLQDVKSCKICNKIFTHKGKYAVYCSDPCKAKKGSN